MAERSDSDEAENPAASDGTARTADAEPTRTADAEPARTRDDGPTQTADDEPARFEETDALALEAALSILGEETRARIVLELGEAVRADGVTPAALSFSELMDRVDVGDSGRFNYHLDRLVGAFVAKTDGGYLLRPPGHFLYRAIVAGTLTERPRLEPFEAGDCPDCGAALAVEYPATHCLSVHCPDCGQIEHTVHLTPRGVEGRSREDLLETAVRKSRSGLGLMAQGVCHACGAPVERSLTFDGPEVCAAHCDYEVYAVLSCTACNAGGAAHPAHVALTTPAVVGFFDDHGRDARSVGHWEEPVVDAEAGTSAVEAVDSGDDADGDPPSVAVPFELDGEEVRVVLDGDLQAVETERLAD